MSRLARYYAALAFALPLLAACQGQTSRDPQIVPIRNMHDQPKFMPQARSARFRDHRSMRPPVPNTVPREMVIDPALDTGLGADGAFVLTVPDSVVSDHGDLDTLLARGRERYGIYCVPCHGGLGDGQGMVPRVSGVAAIRPPTFHDDRIRHMPDGQLYATIRNGIRNMPAYRAQIPVADRWAIVAYVRALQLSQADARTAMRTENDR